MCVCVCGGVCVCVCVSEFVVVYVCARVCVGVCVGVCECVCVGVGVRARTRVCVCVRAHELFKGLRPALPPLLPCLSLRLKFFCFAIFHIRYIQNFVLILI